VARPAATTGPPPGVPAVSAADSLTLVRVGIDPAYPPFSSLDAQGQMVGFDVELIQALAGRAGWQVSLISTPWADLFDALGRGERDLLVSAITITEERRRQMLFSDPYFRAEQVVAVRAGLAVRRLDDLKRWRVSVQAGTLGDDTMRRLMGPHGAAMLQRHDTADKAISALTAGSADAVVCDSGPVLHHLMRHGAGRWSLAPQLSFQPSLYGVAVNPQRPDLLQSLARAWVEVQSDGVYRELMTKYFGPVGLAVARAPG
jgi:polar amino acid transport system substrate-binding protein